MEIFTAVGVVFVAVVAFLGVAALAVIIIPPITAAFRMLHAAGKIRHGGQAIASNMATLAGQGVQE